MVKLVVTDMDGTFLRSDGDFNRELFKEVRDVMKEKGVYFAACTGKQCERVEELFGEDARDMWILGDSATRIKRAGEVFYESYLDREIGQEIIRKLPAMEGELIIIVSTPLGAVVCSGLREEQLQLVKESFASVLVVDDFTELTTEMMKISVHVPDFKSVALKEELSEYDGDAYIVASEPGWLDIADIHTDKGRSVARLQVLLGIGPADTMVFGDGLNDVELMKSGVYSFAMRNGCAETIAAANYVTRSNDEDAVMMTILQMLSIAS